MICTYMFKHGTYYSIVYSTYVHGINMYVLVYTRWVGFQMADRPPAVPRPRNVTLCLLRGRKTRMIGQVPCVLRPHCRETCGTCERPERGSRERVGSSSRFPNEHSSLSTHWQSPAKGRRATGTRLKSRSRRGVVRRPWSSLRRWPGQRWEGAVRSQRRSQSLQ